MRIFRWYFSIAFLLTIIALPLPSISRDSALFVDQSSGKVEIVIQNSKYEYQGGVLKPNESSTIIVRNADKIRHGFTSTLLENLDLRVETDGVITYGRGIKGVYIDPGGMVRLHFFPTQPGKFSFQCDLHPSMKGELLLLSVGAL